MNAEGAPIARVRKRSYTGVVAAIAICAVLSSCVWAWRYERLEAPNGIGDAVYFKNVCGGGFGPPSTIYYPFHGSFVSVDLEFVPLP